MSQEELILTELAATRKELAAVKNLLLSLAGKAPKKPANKSKSVSEYRSMRQESFLKKQINK